MVMRVTEKKILISKYLFFFILIIPAFLIYRTDLRTLYAGWHLIQIPIAVIAIFYYAVKYRFDNIIINCVLIYYFFACISCFLSGYSLNTIKWDLASDIGVSVVAYLLMKKNQKSFINCLAQILFVYLMINTVVMLLYPEGIASGRVGQIVWFLGGKNNIIPWILIGGSCLTLDSFERFGKTTKKTYLKLALCSIQVFLCDSSASLVLILILWLLYMANMIIHNQKIMNHFIGGKKIFYIIVFGFIFVVFFTNRSNILQEFSEWFDKDITFNGRTAIWESAIRYIAESPFFGAGPVLIFDMGWEVKMTHAHCLYLNIFAHYGVFALITLLIGIWNVLKKTNTIPIEVYFGFLLYLIGSIIEVYSLNSLLLFCVILGCYRNEEKLDV